MEIPNVAKVHIVHLIVHNIVTKLFKYISFCQFVYEPVRIGTQRVSGKAWHSKS